MDLVSSAFTLVFNAEHHVKRFRMAVKAKTFGMMGDEEFLDICAATVEAFGGVEPPSGSNIAVKMVENKEDKYAFNIV